MTPDDSVTEWLVQLKAGEPAAAQKLWQRYFGQLVRLARARLRGSPRQAADEEDVALSAFNSFCRRAERGEFPHLDNRANLWHLLVTITARKALDQAKHEGRDRRGGGKILDEAALCTHLAGEGNEEGMEQFVGREPTPEFAAQVSEEYRRLLDLLGDPGLRSVAVWRMEGYSKEEIADRLGCKVRTVERKLQLIRRTWTEGGVA
jgi:DNA-directed RNA polymerase specialized sigma24 family protein